MKTEGYDCVTIPGAVKNTADMKGVGERLCGRKFVDVTADTKAMASATVCSKLYISVITVVEFHSEA